MGVVGIGGGAIALACACAHGVLHVNAWSLLEVCVLSAADVVLWADACAVGSAERRMKVGDDSAGLVLEGVTAA